jgi:hypothetical protein
MKTKNDKQVRSEKREFATPTLRKGGELPVITAGSGDLGTPEVNDLA